MKEMNGILDLVKGLGKKEKERLVKQIMEIMQCSDSTNGCHSMVESYRKARPDCPHCAAQSELGYILKRGFNKNGAQRYYCKKCGKFFVSTTNTTFSGSRKDADTWRKFIQLTIAGKSLVVCKEECGIAYQTAFDWRHKVLNAFAVNQENTQMNGNVEVDEMLIPVSYKGNHVSGSFGKRIRKHGEDNGLPRKSYHRGTDNKSRSPKEKICVFCMVEDGNKSFFAAVPGVGFMTDAMLDATVAKHINKEKAVMLADDYKITKAYFEKNGYKHTILLSNTSDNANAHKPEVRDGLHLQHVNAMHHHIRDFLRPYCGVNSKYLSNYISMFIWLKSVALTKQKRAADKVSLARAAAPDCYITGRQLHSRPAVPRCA